MTNVVEVCPVCGSNIEMIHFGDHYIMARCRNKKCDWFYDSSKDDGIETITVPFNKKRTYIMDDGRIMKFENSIERP